MPATDDQRKAEIILYDLACTKNVCFSPIVWRIRLMLNYKQIPYETVFVEFPDIEPTLEKLGIPPHSEASGSRVKYTVPAIHHILTDKYIMDSVAIATFLNQVYPEPPLLLHTQEGSRIRASVRKENASTYRVSVMPREMNILSSRAQEYFRRTREAILGHPLEDVLAGNNEEEAWAAVDEGMHAVGQMMLSQRHKGSFITGEEPCMTDFFIAGSLQCARTVDEGVFQRYIKYPGYGEIYRACLPYMEKKD